MTGQQRVGTVAELWRFPVKSMGGERLEAAEMTPDGLVGDRAYAVIDVETGKVASGKSVRQFPDILKCRARFEAPPRAGADPPAVVISFPDGSSVTSGGGVEADRALSDFFGRKVRLAQAAPEDFTVDQHHPDLEGADPAGHRNVTVPLKLGATFFAERNAPSPVRAGAFFDLFPISVMTTSTLRRLASLQPESRFAPARFRMNLILATEDDGFLENDWVGRPLSVGRHGGLRVTMPDPRCVITTLEQGELPPDLAVLRALVEHNRLPLGGDAFFPCAGVYAVVTAGGALSVGDEVRLG